MASDLSSVNRSFYKKKYLETAAMSKLVRKT